MWRNRRMVLLTIVVAVLFAAVLIPFRRFALVSGVIELRPGSVIPLAASLLFGPAAAWGAALGNLAVDLLYDAPLATKIFGTAASFFLGCIPYVLWGRLGRLSSGQAPSLHSLRSLAEYWLVTAVASIGSSVILGWGTEVVRRFPYALLGSIAPLNNFAVAAVLGPLLLFVLYRRMYRWGLIWTHIMRPADIAAGGGAIGIGLLLIGSLGGAAGGLLISRTLGVRLGTYGAQLRGNPQYVGTGGEVFGVGLCVLFLLAALFLARSDPNAYDQR